jgi:hypothetical protein
MRFGAAISGGTTGGTGAGPWQGIFSMHGRSKLPAKVITVTATGFTFA